MIQFVDMVEKNKKLKNLERSSDIKGFWKRLWELLLPSQMMMKRIIYLMLAVELTRLAGPYVLKLIIDLIMNFDVSKIAQIVILIFVMFGVNEVVSILQYINDRRIFRVLANTESDLAGKAHSK